MCLLALVQGHGPAKNTPRKGRILNYAGCGAQRYVWCMPLPTGLPRR
jgi:hypothetical protein